MELLKKTTANRPGPLEYILHSKCLHGCMCIVLVHNSGFCNGCITERCLNNTTNVSYNDLVSQLLYSIIEDENY
jgi:hypothetical protein